MGMCKVSGDSHFHASLSLYLSPRFRWAAGASLRLCQGSRPPSASAGLSWRFFSSSLPPGDGPALWPRAAEPALALLLFNRVSSCSSLFSSRPWYLYEHRELRTQLVSCSNAPGHGISQERHARLKNECKEISKLSIKASRSNKIDC